MLDFNNKCDDCGNGLHYIDKMYGASYRFDFFCCPNYNKEYIAKTNIFGETIFEEAIYD